ncbi:hypothetical protein ACIBLA_17580 [Streptomyces sp. NPDC050433]|uniref:scabin-related ADP-ribosyltransferase n=1 Tax=unclassified Streptomyces TaxID=2593676 RepID=UPI0034207619
MGLGRTYYEIDAPGGIDINKTFKDDSRYDYENEVAFPGGIDLSYIKGAWTLQDDGSWGEWVDNPLNSTARWAMFDAKTRGTPAGALAFSLSWIRLPGLIRP